ncbi:MAG TPA: hypothetical protein VFM46_15505 [Pseudomonadales bacterium]|nr:hypothetical protein [Pseudomonadales bacterium]
MDKPYIYEIRVEGHLADRWTEWFEGLSICKDPCGNTLLQGLVIDQSALFGILNKIQSLHLILISVQRLSSEVDL